MNNAQEIQAAGDEWADPFEISTLRRDVSLQHFMDLQDKTKSNYFWTEKHNYFYMNFLMIKKINK